MTLQEANDELCAYTLTHGAPEFIHQYVVDAFAAQMADEQTKPIKLTFALLGLYLHLERNFTGRQVQLAHQYLGRQKRPWPRFVLPKERGSITAREVLAQSAGPARDQAIDAWCRAVWEAFRDAHLQVAEVWATFGQGFRVSP